jgi:hypothetical protein
MPAEDHATSRSITASRSRDITANPTSATQFTPQATNPREAGAVVLGRAWPNRVLLLHFTLTAPFTENSNMSTHSSFIRKSLAFAAALVAASAAHAVPVVALAGSTTYGVPEVNLFTTGPETMAPGITWTANGGAAHAAVFGYTGGYGFAVNGTWAAGLPMIGSDSPTFGMRIDFAAPVAGVGAYLNYAPKEGDPAVISIFDSTNALLESYTLSFLVDTSQVGLNTTKAGYNLGEFHGFLQSTNNISYMTLSGSYIGAANLETVSVAAVPEPETYALMMAGLGVMAWVARRRKAAANA